MTDSYPFYPGGEMASRFTQGFINAFRSDDDEYVTDPDDPDFDPDEDE